GINRSDWSAAAIAVQVGSKPTYQVVARDPRILPRVQIGLLNMCAAKGEWFAVLSAPAGARWEDAASHVDGLKTATGDIVSSYGALYHPWLVARDELRKDGLHTVPPCGAATGIMAFRSFNRGAWIAPANEPLEGCL